jgi:hypothetical protein
VWATVTVEMVSGYCGPSYISDKLCIASGILSLVCVISVIMMEYTISYIEMLFSEQTLRTVCSADRYLIQF